jgi:hypothetical protein
VDGVGVSSALLAACKHPCGSETVQCDDLHVCVFFLSFPLNGEGCRACKLLGQHWGSWWGLEVMGVCVSGGVDDC